MAQDNPFGALADRLHAPLTVLYYDSVDSTNSEAKRLLRTGRQDTLLLIAATQTAGRGRQGKVFYSPRDTGLYMSLVLHPAVPLCDTVTVTAAAAVAVCRAIEQVADIRPEIKWVNDIYCSGKKVCGILTEAVTDGSRNVTSLIIGVGINISTADFPPELPDAGSLSVNIKKADLAAAVTNELLNAVGTDFSQLLPAYKARSFLLGKPIVFTENAVLHNAVVLDIDSAGGLVVRSDGGEIKTIRSGEVTVRTR